MNNSTTWSSIKNQKIKDVFVEYFPALVLSLVGIFMIMYNNRKQIIIDNKNLPEILAGLIKYADIYPPEYSNTTWVITEVVTGFIDTWVIDIPNDPRWYADYIQEYGVAGVDYIIAYPIKAPTISSSDKNVNNSVMYKYLYSNRNIFTIPTTTKFWYVMFVTHKEIPSNKDFFLAIDGRVSGHIKRALSLRTYNEAEYLYQMNKIPLFEWTNINLYEKIDSGKLSLNAFVWQQGNYVEKILIFFK